MRKKSARKKPRPPFPGQSQRRPGIEAHMRPRPQFEAPQYHAAGKLRDKVALITGGDSGIGRAVAVLFAREEADVAIVYLPQEERDAQETCAAVQGAGRRCLLIPGDLRDRDFCRGAVAATVHELRGLDILVNNAAYQRSQDDIEAISENQLERTFRTNIMAFFFLVQASLKHMKKGSAIINCGSVVAARGNDHLLDYAATKGAINAFTKSLAKNLVERGIRVNCVAPGPVWTPLNVSDRTPAKIRRYGEHVPMKRPAQPEEIAPAFVFFASEADSSFISGEILTIQGGETHA